MDRMNRLISKKCYGGGSAAGHHSICVFCFTFVSNALCIYWANGQNYE